MMLRINLPKAYYYINLCEWEIQVHVRLTSFNSEAGLLGVISCSKWYHTQKLLREYDVVSL